MLIVSLPTCPVAAEQVMTEGTDQVLHTSAHEVLAQETKKVDNDNTVADQIMREEAKNTTDNQTIVQDKNTVEVETEEAEAARAIADLQTEQVELGTFNIGTATPIKDIFSDTLLARKIAAQLGKSVENSVTQKELDTFTQLNFPIERFEREIASIEGVQYLTNLVQLSLMGHLVNDLVPISHLKHLQVLEITGNELTNLAPVLAHSAQLTKLHLGGTMSFKENTLTDITAIGAGSFPELTDLELSQNQISDVTVFKSGHFPKLRKLDLSFNNIVSVTNIGSWQFPELTDLELSQNQIIDVTAFQSGHFPKLSKLDLSMNKIVSVPNIASWQLPELTELVLNNNNITDLTPFKAAHWPKITKINLEVQNNISYMNNNLTLPTLSYTNPIKVENTVKDVDGNLIVPTKTGTGSHEDFTYEAPDIIWHIPLPTSEPGEAVSVGWLTVVEISGIAVEYSVWHLILVLPHFSVNYIVGEDIYMTQDEVGPATLLERPKDPVKDDYTFVGWFTAETGGEQWDFMTDKTGEEPMTLYARFRPSRYTLIYVDEIGETIVELRVNVDDDLPVPDDRKKEGYSFDGWFTAAEGGRKWDFAVDKMPEEDLTLHASFSPQSYVLSYIVDGNNYGASVATHFGSEIPLPETPVKAGHTFSGWYTEASGGQQWDFAVDKMPASDLTLYAQFTVNVYKITYLDDTGKTLITNDVNFDERITVLPDKPEKIGYRFLGWYTDRRGGRMWRFDAFKMPANDMTLYARFVPESYRVTYVNERGVKLTEREIEFGEEVFELRAPHKVGYTFLGWYTDASDAQAWDFETEMMPAKAMTLHARYEKM